MPENITVAIGIAAKVTAIPAMSMARTVQSVIRCAASPNGPKASIGMAQTSATTSELIVCRCIS